MSVVEQVLAADTARAALLAEEKVLWDAIASSTADADANADGGDSSGGKGAAAEDATAGWTAEEWTKNLERLAEIGKELVASGAVAAEVHVLLFFSLLLLLLPFSYIFFFFPLCTRFTFLYPDVQLTGADVIVFNNRPKSARSCQASALQWRIILKPLSHWCSVITRWTLVEARQPNLWFARVGHKLHPPIMLTCARGPT